MLDSVEDRLRVFNLTLQELLESTVSLHKKLAKGDIEVEDAMDLWEQRLDMLKFTQRNLKAYIDRERRYAKSMEKQRSER